MDLRAWGWRLTLTSFRHQLESTAMVMRRSWVRVPLGLPLFFVEGAPLVRLAVFKTAKHTLTGYRFDSDSLRSIR